jgi:hypothetical protein
MAPLNGKPGARCHASGFEIVTCIKDHNNSDDSASLDKIQRKYLSRRFRVAPHYAGVVAAAAFGGAR